MQESNHLSRKLQQGGATPHQGAPRAPGEAPWGGMGHELIQQKALKMIRQKTQSWPTQLSLLGFSSSFFNC